MNSVGNKGRALLAFSLNGVKFRSTILSVALMLFSIACRSQTERGNYLAGGSADLSELFENSQANFNFSISPLFGVFVINNLAIGGRYSFAVSSSKVFNPSTNENQTAISFTTFVGPNIKYYFGKKDLKGVVGANGGYSVFTEFIGSNLTNLNGFAFGTSVGIAYFFNRHVSLETSLYQATAGYATQAPATRVGISVGLFAFLDKKTEKP